MNRYTVWTCSDSIGQGYGDIDYEPTIKGVPLRLAVALGSFAGANPAWSIFNLGMSGWTPSQYLGRMKRIIGGTPTNLRPSILLFQIYSPNGMFPAGTYDSTQLLTSHGPWQTALDAESFCQENGILFMPWFFGPGPYGFNSPDTTIRDNILTPAIARWGAKLLRHDDVLQDPAVNLATQGLQWLSAYSKDGTHPDSDGYDAILSGGSLGAGNNLLTRFTACANAVGISF